jgi:hypothetical protein
MQRRQSPCSQTPLPIPEPYCQRINEPRAEALHKPLKRRVIKSVDQRSSYRVAHFLRP